jgi:hypothetical protein
MHISCVRGSPLIRTILILAVLVASGIGFARLTHRGSVEPAGQGIDPVVLGYPSGFPAKVYLVFSAAPGEVILRSPGKVVALSAESSTSFSGQALISDSTPVLFLTATRTEPSEEEAPPFFAKLVVEAEGKKTFTHIFDSPGDIDDFVELPF